MLLQISLHLFNKGDFAPDVRLYSAIQEVCQNV